MPIAAIAWRGLPCTAILTCLLTAMPAGAQTGPALLEEITVTARKVEENIMDIPVAVTPITQQQIRDLTIFNLDDLALYTPGLSFNTAFGRRSSSARPAMRGVSTFLNGINNASSVAYFVDGVYMSGTPQLTELFSFERVEVLRGPQTALFGRGTYAGAISYVTRAPSEAFEMQAEASGGEDGYRQLVASASGPIGGLLGYYVAAGLESFDGQFTNQFDGGRLGRERTRSITGKLVFTPTNDFSASLRLSYDEIDDSANPLYLQPATLNNCCFRTADSPRSRGYYQGEVRPDWNRIEANTAAFDNLDPAVGLSGSGTEADRWIAALELDWAISEDLRLVSRTGYIEDDAVNAIDASYAGYEPFPGPFTGWLFYVIEREIREDLSQELRLDWRMTDDLRFTVGAYYYDGRERIPVRIQPFGDGSISPLSFVAAAQIDRDNFTSDVENRAVFGSAYWDLTDRLNLGLEIRYAEDEIETSDNESGILNSATFYNVTPRVSAIYKISDSLNIYGNIAKGTKPGDFNDADKCETLPTAVDEEVGWSYELGIKATLFDQRANLNAAAYLFDIDDQQVTTTCEDPDEGTAVAKLNAGETEILGLELDGTLLITDELSAGFTYAYTHSEITEYIDVEQADLRGSLGGATQTRLLGSVAGNQSGRVPEHMFSLFARFQRDFGKDRSWYIGGDYAFESTKYAQVFNYAETGDRHVVGARAGVVLGNWELALWGKNLTDDDTPVDATRFFDTRTGQLPDCTSFGTAISCTQPTEPSNAPRAFHMAPPRLRMFGVTVTLRFGAG